MLGGGALGEALVRWPLGRDLREGVQRGAGQLWGRGGCDPDKRWQGSGSDMSYDMLAAD